MRSRYGFYPLSKTAFHQANVLIQSPTASSQKKMHLRYGLLLCCCISMASDCFHGLCSAQSNISDANLTELLQDIRSRGFLTATTILSVIPKGVLKTPTTLLVPTDEAMSNISSISQTSSYGDMISYHMIKGNLSWKQLRLLPVGTWIPTYLPGKGVQVTSNTASGDFALDNVRLVSPDICAGLSRSGITCQGIAGILVPRFSSPLAAPAVPAPAPSPTPPGLTLSAPVPSADAPVPKDLTPLAPGTPPSESPSASPPALVSASPSAPAPPPPSTPSTAPSPALILLRAPSPSPAAEPSAGTTRDLRAVVFVTLLCVAATVGVWHDYYF